MSLDGDPSDPSTRRFAPVLVLAPTANDARLTSEFLTENGYGAQPCRDIEELGRNVNERCGCVIVAEEAMNDEVVQILLAALKRKPAWSDIPVIIIAGFAELPPHASRRPRLDKPFRQAELAQLVSQVGRRGPGDRLVHSLPQPGED